MIPVLAIAAITLTGLLGHKVGFRRGHRAGRVDQIRVAVFGKLADVDRAAARAASSARRPREAPLAMVPGR